MSLPQQARKNLREICERCKPFYVTLLRSIKRFVSVKADAELGS